MITNIPIHTYNIENNGYHLLIEAILNNKKANMLIDTGASQTVFDKNRITNFVGKINFDLNDKLSTGLGTNSMQSHRTTIRKIKLGDILIKDYDAILLDLSHVNRSYKKLKLKPIDGVVGSDLLLRYKAIINYGKPLLKLKTNT